MGNKKMFGISEVSRRTFLKGVGAVTATAALTGCSKGEGDTYTIADPGSRTKVEERLVSCSCRNNCANGCHLNAHVRDGRVVKTSMAPMPDPRYNRICLRGLSHVQRIYGKNRLLYPLKRKPGTPRGGGEWVRIDWQTAIKEIATSFKDIINDPGLDGPLSLAFLQGSGNFGGVHGRPCGYWRLFNVMGTSGITPNLDLALPTGFSKVYGTPALSCLGMNEPADLVNAKTIICWGMNPASAHMQTWHFIADAMENGATYINVDIMMSGAAARADKFVHLRPASDLLFAMSIIDEVIKNDWVHYEFMFKNTVANFLVYTDTMSYVKDGGSLVALKTDGTFVTAGKDSTLGDKATLPGIHSDYRFEAPAGTQYNGRDVKTAYQLLKEHAAAHPASLTQASTGVHPDVVKEVARIYTQEGPSSILCGFGPDHFTNGHHIYHAIGILASITGNIGKKGAGVGVFEAMTPYHDENSMKIGVTSGISYPALADTFNIPGVPVVNEISQIKFPGMQNGGAGELFMGQPRRVRALMIAYSNFVNTWVEMNTNIKFLTAPGTNGDEYKLKTFVVTDIEMTDSAHYADYVLPVAHWFEMEELCGYGTHPFIVYQEKAADPLGESLPDMDIARLLAKELGYIPKLGKDIASYFTQTNEEFFETALNAIKYKAWFKTVAGRDPAPDDVITPTRLRNEKVLRAIPGDAMNRYTYPVFRKKATGNETVDDLHIDSMTTGTKRLEIFSDTVMTFFDYGQAELSLGPVSVFTDPDILKYERLPTWEEPNEAWTGATTRPAQAALLAKYPLINFSQRARWRVHSQWFDTPWLRELDPEPVVYINPADAGNIITGDLVKISNDRGYYLSRAIISGGVRPGMVDAARGWQNSQYKEIFGDENSTNSVTNRKVHPVSTTQGFFDALVKIEKYNG